MKRLALIMVLFFASDCPARPPYDFEILITKIEVLQKQRGKSPVKDAKIEKKQAKLWRKVIGEHANWF